MSSTRCSPGYMASLSKPSDGPVSRLLNRRLSTRISCWLAGRGHPPSPDAVSVVAAWLVALGGLLFAAGHPAAAGLAAQAGSVLDGVDGELARLLGRSSKAGALLDTVLDRLSDIVLLLGAALAAAAVLPPVPLSALTALAVAGDLMVSYIHAFTEKLLGRHPSLAGGVSNIAGRDVRLFIAFLAGLAGRPDALLAAIAALGLGYSVAQAAAVLRKLDER